MVEMSCSSVCEQSQLQLQASRIGRKQSVTSHRVKPKSTFSKSKMRAQLLCAQISEYHEFGMPEDENLLDIRDLHLAGSKPFEAPYNHPLKLPITPSAPFVLRKVPYGAFRDVAFADLIGVDNGFICSLLKYRYKTTPAVQNLQLKDITLLIWHSQTNRDWKAAAPWPKTPAEQIEMIGRIIRDLGHAVTLGY